MNRSEFVKAVAAVTEKTQKEVREMLDAMQDVAFEAMANCEEAKIFEGVSFVGVQKEACQKRNPATGGMVDVPAKVVPKAKFGAAAKRAVNGEE